MGEMKRALSAHEGREENQAFPSSCTGQGPSLGRQAEMAAQITCLVRRQQERSHRTLPISKMHIMVLLTQCASGTPRSMSEFGFWGV